MDDTEAYRSLRSSLSRQPRGILRRESFPNRNPSQTSDVGLSVQFAADDLESTAGSESFLQLGDFDTPRTDESVTDSSTRASALYDVGLARLQLGDVRGAYEDFKEASRLEPTNMTIWQSYDDAYHQIEHVLTAESTWAELFDTVSPPRCTMQVPRPTTWRDSAPLTMDVEMTERVEALQQQVFSDILWGP